MKWITRQGFQTFGDIFTLYSSPLGVCPETCSRTYIAKESRLISPHAL